MKKVLFMHTGSKNHGCEAIVKTTSMILGKKDLILWSFHKNEDQQYGVDSFYENIVESEEIKKYSSSYFKAMFKRKILKDRNANMNEFLKNQFKDNIAISVGGDNYCYPWSAKQACELDKEIRKYCKKSVLWGCSIDEEAITSEMQKDLEQFDLITARESITFELLKKFNFNTVLVSDPAFILKAKNVKLPDNFLKNNTVGINISPLIMKYGEKSELILDNYRNMIKFIIEDTDMNICLIPHVVWEDNNDQIPCENLLNEFKDTGRIVMIKDGTCEELKGYISNCRFFVGARTHATIAAYSTCVPTLVVGYSVKSKGIARDIYGTEKNHVIPVQNLIGENNLKELFSDLINRELEEVELLNKVMPNYIEKAYDSLHHLNKLLEREE